MDPVNEALKKMSEKDPSFQFAFDREEAEFKIAGMSHLHLEVCYGNLRQATGCPMEIGPYEIIYRQRSTDRGFVQQQPFMTVELSILKSKEEVAEQFIKYKRGEVISKTTGDDDDFPQLVTLKSEVPLVEMNNFLDELRGFNEDTGSFSCCFLDYRDMPED